MICAKCNSPISPYGEAYEVVDTFLNGSLVGSSKRYHPYCFIELAEEFAEDKVRSKLLEAQRERDILKESCNKEMELRRQVEAQLKLVVEDKTDKKLLIELAAKRAEVIGLYEDKMLSLHRKLDDAKALALKSLESSDSGRFILGQAQLAADTEEKLFSICWQSLWACVGRAINVESNIKELVDKYNGVAHQLRTAFKSIEAQESEVASLKASLGNTQESLFTAVKDRDLYKKEVSSAQYDRDLARAEQRDAAKVLRGVTVARDRLAAKLATIRAATQDDEMDDEDFYQKFK